MEINRLTLLALYALLFGLVLVLVPRAGFVYDVDLFALWGKHIFEQGLGNAYQLEANQYNPLFQYVLYVYAHLAGSVEKVAHYRNYLKGLILVFDFAGAWLAVRFLPGGTREQRFVLSLLLLLNAAYLYNTLVWEQIDAMYTAFAFAAVALALWQRPVWSLVAFVLALNAKAQALLFAPPLLLLWLPLWRRPVVVLRAALAGAVTQFLILVPFIWFSWQSGLPRIWQLNTDSTIGMQPLVSMNAFNLWTLLWHGQDTFVPDDPVVHGLSYHAWGLLFFGVASALALAPLLAQAVRNWLARQAWTPDQYALVLLSCALIPLVSSFFNTRMHERYWHPSILFLGAYAFASRNYWPYALASAAYFFNLEGVLRFLGLYNYEVLVFRPRFVACFFAGIIVFVFLLLYRHAAQRQQLSLNLKPRLRQA